MNTKITAINDGAMENYISILSKNQTSNLPKQKLQESAIIYDKQTLSSSNGLYNIKSILTTANNTLTDQQIQSGLSVLDLYKGPIDGNLNSNLSKQAIKNFQQVYCDTQNDGIMSDKMKTKLSGLLNFRRNLINDSNFDKAAKQLNLDNIEKSNLATIWTFLRKRMGLTTAQAAGVCGNLSHESYFSTDNLQDGSLRNDHDTSYKYDSADNKGYGLMQWTDETEKKKLLQTANNMNVKVSDINAQLVHFRNEMTTGIYRNKWPEIKKMSSRIEVCDYFAVSIEKAGKAHIDKREQDTNTIYNYLKNH